MTKSYRSDIEASLQGRKVSWGYEPTVEAIPGVLGAETVRALAMGKVDGKYAVLVLSQSRITLLRSSSLGRVSSEDLTLSAITSVEQKRGGMASDILLHASGNGLKIEWVQNSEADSFATVVRRAIDEAKSPSQSPSAALAGPTRRTSEQIKKAIRDLAELRDEGLINNSQFEAKQAELLAEL